MKTILLFCLLLISPFLHAQNGEKNFIDLPYVEVNGKAEMEVVPDKIYLRIVVSEKDNKNKYPIVDLEKKFLAALNEIGIDVSKDLLLHDLSSDFKNQLIFKNDIILTKEYTLIVHDGKTIGRVARELEKIGISNISIEKTDHSKIEEFRNEVRMNAVKAAKRNAETLTSGIGQNIGKAIYIQEMFSGVYPMQANVYMARKSMSGSISESADTDAYLSFEKIKLEFSVLARFELK